jgi:hypothetical protein
MTRPVAAAAPAVVTVFQNQRALDAEQLPVHAISTARSPHPDRAPHEPYGPSAAQRKPKSPSRYPR